MNVYPTVFISHTHRPVIFDPTVLDRCILISRQTKSCVRATIRADMATVNHVEVSAKIKGEVGGDVPVKVHCVIRSTGQIFENHLTYPFFS